MDYFKATEKYLYNYRGINVSIVTLEQQLEMVKADFKGAGAVDTTREPVSRTNKFTSATEDEVLQREREIAVLQKKIRTNKEVINRIDKGIECLSDLEKKVVELRFISENRHTWIEIASMVQYDADHCRKHVRAKAVKSIAVALFGIDAMISFGEVPLFKSLVS